IRPARIPKAPDGPARGLILVFGPVLGLLAGIGIAFSREQFDKTVRTSEDVVQFAQMPMLGAIPSMLPTKTRFLDKEKGNNQKEARLLGRPTDNGRLENSEPTKLSSFRFIPYPSGSSTLSFASEIAGMNQLQLRGHSGPAESYRALRTSLL